MGDRPREGQGPTPSKPVKGVCCMFAGCQQRASYGTVHRRPVYCSSHKLAGMRDVMRKLCEHQEPVPCPKNPVFGFPGEKTRFCKQHRLEGMVDVHSKKCIHPHCLKYPSYGYDKGKPFYCREHMIPGTVHVKRTCQYASCTKYASFGTQPGKPLYCKEHKSINMEKATLRRTCKYPGCQKRPRHMQGPDGKLSFCGEHYKLATAGDGLPLPTAASPSLLTTSKKGSGPRGISEERQREAEISLRVIRASIEAEVEISSRGISEPEERDTDIFPRGISVPRERETEMLSRGNTEKTGNQHAAVRACGNGVYGWADARGSPRQPGVSIPNKGVQDIEFRSHSSLKGLATQLRTAGGGVQSKQLPQCMSPGNGKASRRVTVGSRGSLSNSAGTPQQRDAEGLEGCRGGTAGSLNQCARTQQGSDAVTVGGCCGCTAGRLNSAARAQQDNLATGQEVNYLTGQHDNYARGQQDNYTTVQQDNYAAAQQNSHATAQQEDAPGELTAAELEAAWQQCMEGPCGQPAWYGDSANSPKHCRQHRQQDNWKVCWSSVCESAGCDNSAVYGLPPDKAPVFCEVHKENDMVNFMQAHDTCIMLDCSYPARWGFDDGLALFCDGHSSPSMHRVVRNSCCHPGCGAVALVQPPPGGMVPTSALGIPPQYCDSHMPEAVIRSPVLPVGQLIDGRPNVLAGVDERELAGSRDSGCVHSGNVEATRGEGEKAGHGWRAAGQGEGEGEAAERDGGAAQAGVSEVAGRAERPAGQGERERTGNAGQAGTEAMHVAGLWDGDRVPKAGQAGRGSKCDAGQGNGGMGSRAELLQNARQGNGRNGEQDGVASEPALRRSSRLRSIGAGRGQGKKRAGEAVALAGEFADVDNQLPIQWQGQTRGTKKQARGKISKDGANHRAAGSGDGLLVDDQREVMAQVALVMLSKQQEPFQQQPSSSQATSLATELEHMQTSSPWPAGSPDWSGLDTDMAAEPLSPSRHAQQSQHNLPSWSQHTTQQTRGSQTGSGVNQCWVRNSDTEQPTWANRQQPTGDSELQGGVRRRSGLRRCTVEERGGECAAKSVVVAKRSRHWEGNNRVLYRDEGIAGAQGPQDNVNPSAEQQQKQQVACMTTPNSACKQPPSALHKQHQPSQQQQPYIHVHSLCEQPHVHCSLLPQQPQQQDSTDNSSSLQSYIRVHSVCEQPHLHCSLLPQLPQQQESAATPASTQHLQPPQQQQPYSTSRHIHSVCDQPHLHCNLLPQPAEQHASAASSNSQQAQQQRLIHVHSVCEQPHLHCNFIPHQQLLGEVPTGHTAAAAGAGIRAEHPHAASQHCFLQHWQRLRLQHHTQHPLLLQQQQPAPLQCQQQQQHYQQQHEQQHCQQLPTLQQHQQAQQQQQCSQQSQHQQQYSKQQQQEQQQQHRSQQPQQQQQHLHSPKHYLHQEHDQHKQPLLHVHSVCDQRHLHCNLLPQMPPGTDPSQQQYLQVHPVCEQPHMHCNLLPPPPQQGDIAEGSSYQHSKQAPQPPYIHVHSVCDKQHMHCNLLPQPQQQGDATNGSSSQQPQQQPQAPYMHVHSVCDHQHMHCSLLPHHQHHPPLLKPLAKHAPSSRQAPHAHPPHRSISPTQTIPPPTCSAPGKSLPLSHCSLPALGNMALDSFDPIAEMLSMPLCTTPLNCCMHGSPLNLAMDLQCPWTSLLDLPPGPCSHLQVEHAQHYPSLPITAPAATTAVANAPAVTTTHAAPSGPGSAATAAAPITTARVPVTTISGATASGPGSTATVAVSATTTAAASASVPTASAAAMAAASSTTAAATAAKATDTNATAVGGVAGAAAAEAAAGTATAEQLGPEACSYSPYQHHVHALNTLHSSFEEGHALPLAGPCFHSQLQFSNCKQPLLSRTSSAPNPVAATASATVASVGATAVTASTPVSASAFAAAELLKTAAGAIATAAGPMATAAGTSAATAGATAITARDACGLCTKQKQQAGPDMQSRPLPKDCSLPVASLGSQQPAPGRDLAPAASPALSLAAPLDLSPAPSPAVSPGDTTPVASAAQPRTHVVSGSQTQLPPSSPRSAAGCHITAYKQLTNEQEPVSSEFLGQQCLKVLDSRLCEVGTANAAELLKESGALEQRGARSHATAVEGRNEVKALKELGVASHAADTEGINEVDVLTAVDPTNEVQALELRGSAGASECSSDAVLALLPVWLPHNSKLGKQVLQQQQACVNKVDQQHGGMSTRQWAQVLLVSEGISRSVGLQLLAMQEAGVTVVVEAGCN